MSRRIFLVLFCFVSWGDLSQANGVRDFVESQEISLDTEHRHLKGKRGSYYGRGGSSGKRGSSWSSSSSSSDEYQIYFLLKNYEQHVLYK